MNTRAGTPTKRVIGLSADAPIPVSRAIRRIREIVGGSVVKAVWLSGEIADVRRDASGNVWFIVEHDGCGVPCVMWVADATRVRFSFDRGTTVAVLARLEMLDRDARVRARVSAVRPVGVGEQKRQLERVREQLRRDGLLDPRRKHSIPAYPRRVAVITSITGAALQDILVVARRRHPGIQLLVIPAAVQGPTAPVSISRALGLAQRVDQCDTVIIARGGGAASDLAVFHDEMLARAIASCRIPVITAIGHETDHLIADEVADLRVSTPSTAAERAIPERVRLLQSLDGLQVHARQAIRARVARASTRLGAVRAALSRALSVRCQRNVVRTASMKERLFRSTSARLEREAAKLEHLRGDLRRSAERKITREHARLARLAGVLEALDPSSVLSRGYAMLVDAHGRVLSSIAEVQQARTIIIRMHDGELAFKIATTSTSEEPVDDPELRAECSSSRNHRRRTR